MTPAPSNIYCHGENMLTSPGKRIFTIYSGLSTERNVHTDVTMGCLDAIYLVSWPTSLRICNTTNIRTALEEWNMEYYPHNQSQSKAQSQPPREYGQIHQTREIMIYLKCTMILLAITWSQQQVVDKQIHVYLSGSGCRASSSWWNFVLAITW